MFNAVIDTMGCMLNHITLFVSDIERSKKFYAAALAPLGYRLLRDKGASAGFGQSDTDGARDFWIKQVPETLPEVKSFSCLAFTATNKEQVDGFHKAALEAGATDNGAPGYRPKYHPGYYAAFIHDPDGYNIEVVWDDLKVNA